MIKYLIALLLGLAVGTAAFLALLYLNPLTAQNRLSPITVTDNDVLHLNYPAVASNMLIYTNDGESQVAPHPTKVLQLWEPPIRKTDAIATVLTNSRSQVLGVGLKFSSDSEATDILNGHLLVDSVWHIYLPGKGSLFIEQQENYWSYVRDIVIPARWNSGDNWRGNWRGNISVGPGALGTARVVGGSGIFSGLESEGLETLSSKAYSVAQGLVAADGELAIEIPRIESEPTPDP
jgi:hypothetical protein